MNLVKKTYWLMWAVLLTTLVVMLYNALMLPIVYAKYPEGNCLYVDDVYKKHSCSNLPKTYHHQWVSQKH